MTNEREKPGGGISIGSMSGGAVGQGPGARAEDRSERAGAPAAGAGDPAAAPVPAPDHGGIAVGSLSGGALAQGDDAEAVDASRRLLTVTPELLHVARELRLDLPRLTRAEGDGLDELDAELAGLEDDARREGRTRPGRLARLRALLSDGATAAGGLASAVALVQSISQLLA
ncbi:hypothetical protein BLA24_27175 [Streptomyces cinnamoneus]|uniref:Uncharacterized protein n=1 Tax=Streptomyces cinnamoneus TaxID=53446 RepID=A0A2G1XBZ6_STRCJ|nr:hypothetical protein [Streptomyces cinnamoneus]PHQ48763.1 hypothetical protein BLA24_27175 [Streptomyces cinnamoneus]PPT14589.1 hypothetical protein CYQ11_18480 [Streptomyces cinnamoneus]